jgi:hypothetical protein
VAAGLGDIGALIWIILKILVITVPVIISWPSTWSGNAS